ncbi:MAG: hypothetical protein ACI835_005497 [Planctomycetota bacterium]|jgi:hypothetical protein
MALSSHKRSFRSCLALSATLLSLACGGGPAAETDEATVGSGDQSAVAKDHPETDKAAAQAAANLDSGSQPESAQEASFQLPEGTRPSAPDFNFTDRRYEFGPDYGGMKERVNAGKDGWPTEVIAAIAKDRIHSWITSGLEGAALSCEGLLDPNFEGASALRPELAEALADTGWLRIRRMASAGERTLTTAAEIDASLEELCTPFRDGTRREVRVSVARMDPGASGSARDFDSHIDIRLSSDIGLGGLQVNTSWSVSWQLSSDGKRVLIKRLNVREYEEIGTDRRALHEKTLALLGATEFGLKDLQVGSLETWGRMDRLAGPTSLYIAMQGICVADLNGDGREDLYMAQPFGRPNRLFLQSEGVSLIDAGAGSEVDFLDETSGVIAIDMDGDGARDLVMAQGAHLQICWNDGTAHFPEETYLEGEVDSAAQIYSIDVADPDQDGDLDIYATRYVGGGVSGGVPSPYHDADNGASNFYWKSVGPREYQKATAEVGLDHNNSRFSLDSAWEDLDGDGDLDLYVTNDFGRNNLYRNDDGHFTDVAMETGTSDMAAGMGISIADVNQDGLLDLYISNMFTAAGGRVTSQPAFMRAGGLALRAMYQRHTRGNTLLLGSGNGVYRDATETAGVGPGGWTWGAMFSDLDNDGLADILVPNGFLSGVKSSRDLESYFWRVVVNASPEGFPPTDSYRSAWLAISNMSQIEGLSWNGRERNFGYSNIGEGRFVDATALTGFDYIDDARCVAIVDWDQDGRLDAWVRNRSAPTLRFLHNQSEAADWIAFELAGTSPNTDGIGALVTVEALGRKTARRVYGGDGYLSSSSRRLHFGLGPLADGQEDAENKSSAKVFVQWPNGEEQVFDALATQRGYHLVQGGKAMAIERSATPGLNEVAAQRLPEVEQRSLKRVPALDKMPISTMVLPTFEGEPRPLSGFSPKPVLLVMWGSWDDESVRVLQQLEASKDEFAAADVTIFPITLDSARETGYARELLTRIGLTEHGGRFDRRSRMVIEMVMMEILGNYEDLPLPVGLLMDARGAPSVMYIGEVEPAVVLADAACLGSDDDDPSWRWETALTGGRWRRARPTRALGRMGDFLRKAGFPELAHEMKQELERRKERRKALRQAKTEEE